MGGMRRALTLAVALVAASAVPAQAHDSLTAARLGAEVQVALRKAGVQPASPVAARVFGPRTLRLAIMPILQAGAGARRPTPAELTEGRRRPERAATRARPARSSRRPP